jgi:hypothetical protein
VEETTKRMRLLETVRDQRVEPKTMSETIS